MNSRMVRMGIVKVMVMVVTILLRMVAMMVIVTTVVIVTGVIVKPVKLRSKYYNHNSDQTQIKLRSMA